MADNLVEVKTVFSPGDFGDLTSKNGALTWFVFPSRSDRYGKISRNKGAQNWVPQAPCLTGNRKRWDTQIGRYTHVDMQMLSDFKHVGRIAWSAWSRSFARIHCKQCLGWFGDGDGSIEP